MASKFPSNLPTADDWTSANAGMGRTKSNKNDPNDLDHNYRAEEYNQIALEVISLATKLGINLSEPASYGDACLGSVDELLEWFCWRADRAGAIDHFTFNAYATAIFSALNTAGSYASVAGGVGIGQIALGAGLREGFTQATYHFHQRSSYYRCRWSLSDIPVGAADYLEFGIEDAAAHFVKFHVTDPTSPTNWTVEVDNGASTTDVLTVTPAADTWYTFEILTTATDATFWYERGAAAEQKVVIAAAPFNGICRPFCATTQAAGTFFFFCDYMGVKDTRPL